MSSLKAQLSTSREDNRGTKGSRHGDKIEEKEKARVSLVVLVSEDVMLILSSKSRLLEMPPELQSMIAGKLDAVSLCNLKLVCKSLDTWTGDPPELSASEWLQYHSNFETRTRKRRKLQSFGCAGCKKVLEHGLFSDAAARRPLIKGRLCISCAIRNGHYDKYNFILGGEQVFGCRGCQKAKPLGEEDLCLVDKGRWYEPLPPFTRDLFVASRGRRWCHSCWSIVENYRSLDR
ncbi:hypothetical protein BDR22DRAFT_296019 [Usnea florida]